jgi:iron complex outermembrane receptor protein
MKQTTSRGLRLALVWFRIAARAVGLAGMLGGAVALAAPSGSGRRLVASIESMKKMSLDELLSLQVTTMSRKEELWWAAPGAIEVLTNEEIHRSTAQNLPEALRLATGIDVAQPNARSWAISARGFNVLAANKISVLMDGRSLFTPFFSGVQWDAQDTMLEDIDRIEVVRGPVGALWGSFAVNGFIQIVTKSAEDTQGALVSAGAGTEDPGFLSLRYGGKLARRTFYRVYAKYVDTDWTYLANGRHAEPSTDFFQSGFRLDSLVDDDTTVTLQGDVYTNNGLPEDRLQTEIGGANILGRVRRSFSADSDLEVMAYFDHTRRLIPAQWQEFRDTGALTVKYRLPAGRHDLLFGSDVNVSRDDIARLGVARMDPPQRTTHNAGLFAQDTIAIVPGRTALTLGAKGEHNSFSGFEFEPSIRGAWTPTGRTTVWGAVSRAVRAPVRLDEDLLFVLDSTVIVRANDDFRSETALAYELGWRQQVGETLTLDVATFYNEYDHLRTTEPEGAAPLPVTFKNGLRARATGAETTVMYQPFTRLFLKGSYRLLDFDFIEAPNTRDATHGSSEGNDPRHLLTISAHADLPWQLELDAALRYVSSRPNPATEGFAVVDLRAAWSPSDNWELSLTGRNLFQGLHRELVTTNSLNEFIGPSCTFKITWKY